MDVMSKKKRAYLILGALTFLLCLTAYLSVLSLFETPLSDEQREGISEDIKDIKRPQSSSTWTLYTNITIDDSATGIGAQNWTWAVSQDWCSGSGTWADPYLLENITIYLNNTNTACINISNSHSVYFKISNCIVRNNASDYGIGIGLTNVWHGLITDSTCDDNGDDGLYCVNCINITLYMSTFDNNHHNGINMDNCTTFTITRNDGNLNGLSGAYLVNSTYNIFQNACEFSNNTDGITLIDSDLNNITTCNIYNNTNYGIEILDSDGCYITSNDIEDNLDIGILIYEEGGDSQNNVLYANDFDTNTNYNAQDNGTTNQWDNGVDSGNEWDDYPGADLDDDGIGDDPYDISGSASAQDNYPIWDDGDSIAPVITISLPSTNDVFGNVPSFSLTIVEAVGIYNRWYTLDAGAHNTTFTGTTGTITATDWARISGLPGQKLAVTLTFYVNDTTGNIGSASVAFFKYIAPSIEHGDEEEIFMYALTENQIYLFIAFAFGLNLLLLRFMMRPKKK